MLRSQGVYIMNLTAKEFDDPHDYIINNKETHKNRKSGCST